MFGLSSRKTVMTLFTAQEETLDSALPEILTKLNSHYEELSLHQGRYSWRCNWAWYYEMERQGQLLLVTLRNNGVLVGYFVGFVKPGLQYQDCLTLSMDVFYIIPEARNKGSGALQLFRKGEAMAREGGERFFTFE